jgi:hypothetical protein
MERSGCEAIPALGRWPGGDSKGSVDMERTQMKLSYAENSRPSRPQRLSGGGTAQPREVTQ